MEIDLEENEYTHEAVICASVVDLYSSCVAFSDANASSLAWLISLNCCI